MILTPNTSSAPFSGPGAAPSTSSTEGATDDQSFFGLLVAQAAADTAPDAALPVEAAFTAEVPTLAASEPAAPITTALLVGQSWQSSAAPSPAAIIAAASQSEAGSTPDQAAPIATAQPTACAVAALLAGQDLQPLAAPSPQSVVKPETTPTAAPPLATPSLQPGVTPVSSLPVVATHDTLGSPADAILPIQRAAPVANQAQAAQIINSGEHAPELLLASSLGDRLKTEEEEVSTESEQAVIAAAALLPLPAPEPVKIVPAGVSNEPAPAASIAMPISTGRPVAPNAPVDEAATNAGTAVPPAAPPANSPEPATSAEQKPRSGQAPVIDAQSVLEMTTLTEGELRAAVEAAQDKQGRNEPERRETAARAISSVDQPALAAVAAAPVRHATPITHGSSFDPAAAELTAGPDALTAVGDAAQGGAGGLDQFSAGVAHEGAAGRPDAAGRAQSAQTDFKAELAAADASAEPSRAAQIATVHIEKAAASRNTDALTIQLEPLDLGKIEVRLDFGSEGRVQASIVADKTETLDLLQRDSRSLEKALQSAGLQTDAGSLNFNLRGDARSGREFGQRGYKGNALNGREQDITEIQIVAARPSPAQLGRVDIRI